MYGVGTENDFKDLKGKLNDFKVFSDRVRNHLIVVSYIQYAVSKIIRRITENIS